MGSHSDLPPAIPSSALDAQKKRCRCVKSLLSQPGFSRKGFRLRRTNYDGSGIRPAQLLSQLTDSDDVAPPPRPVRLLHTGLQRRRAQDDIFGDAPGLFGAEPAAVAAQPVDEEIEDPLVRQLLEHAGRGSIPLADSIASLVRLERWSEVDRLLARTAGMNIDDVTLAEMFSHIGPTLFLQVKQRADLSGPAQAGMDKLRVAANKYAESAARLNRAIEGLGSSSSDDQLESARVLLSGGNAAVAALVAAAVVDQPTAKRDNILRTILALGGGGVDALRQLALYGTPEVRAAALSSLARISRRDHLVDLVTALHARMQARRNGRSPSQILNG